MMILADSVSFPQAGVGLAVAILLMGALLMVLNLKEKLFPKIEGTKSVKVEAPLEVRLEEQFPTRREFEKLEGEVCELQREIPAMERRIIGEVKEVGKDLSAKIDEFGSSSHAGRGKIWQELNEVRERVSAAETVTKQF